jgi:hypothetical protein
VMPSMKYRWPNAKMSSIGSVESTSAAMISW